jgi:hypothetical protein
MRRRLTAFLLLVVLLAPAVASPQSAGPRVKDSVVGIDKLKHFLLSGFVESVAFAGLQAAGAGRDASLAGAGGVTVVVALGREVHDRRATGLFSLGDLMWDALGAGAAMLLLTRIGR